MPEESYVELGEDESFSIQIMHESVSTSTMNSTSTENKLNNDSASAIDKLECDSKTIERRETDDSAPGENKMRLEEDADYDTNNPEDDSTSSDEKSLQGMKEDSALNPSINKLKNDSTSTTKTLEVDSASGENKPRLEEDSASAMNKLAYDPTSKNINLGLKEDSDSATNKLKNDSASEINDKLDDDSASASNNKLVDDSASASNNKLVDDSESASNNKLVDDSASASNNKLVDDSASASNDKLVDDSASASNNKLVDDSASAITNKEEDSASAINSELEESSALGLQLPRLEEDTESATNKLEEGSTSVEDKLIDDSYDTLEFDSDGGEEEPKQEKRTVQWSESVGATPDYYSFNMEGGDQNTGLYGHGNHHHAHENDHHDGQRHNGGPQERKSSVASGKFRRISDIINPLVINAERKISSTINPFYHQLDDEKELKEPESPDVLNLHHQDLERWNDDDDDDDDGGSMDDDVRDDEDREARKQCCGEARLNCGRFKSEMVKQGRQLKESAQKINYRKCCGSFFTMAMLKRRLPIMQWLPKYRMEHFQGDLVAGITVGLTVIPQSIAYAAVAGVPPEVGLYTAFLGSFVYVIFGSAKDITLGPSAVSSLLVALFATSTSPVPGDVTTSIALAFFVGLIEIGMFLINFGYFMNFISFPVIKAFTVASAITIAMTQVKRWWGESGVPRDFMPQLYWTVAKIPESRLWDFVLGVICIVIIVVLRKIKEVPWKTKYEDLTVGWKIIFKTIWLFGLGRNIVAIVAASIAAYIFMLNGMKPFTLTGKIPPGVPPFKLPTFSIHDPKTNVTYGLTDISNSIGAGFIIVPILGLIEAIAIGNVFARKFNYRIDCNQEFLAYGIGNFLTAFVGGYPITGTFSRTAVNAQCGVKTPLGGIYTGVIVLIALQFATPLMYYIPSCSLAVVILMAVMDMVTFHKIWVFWKTQKIDLIPWILTFVLSFVISIAYGVIIGAGVSLLLLLWPTTKPKIKKIMRKLKSGEEEDSSVVLVTFNNGLLYPAIENMKDKLVPLYSGDGVEKPKGVILDFQHVAVADTTTIQGIRLMLENFNKNGIPLVICNMQKPVNSLLTRAKPKFLIMASSIEEAEEKIQASISAKTDVNSNKKKAGHKQPNLTNGGLDNPAFDKTESGERSSRPTYPNDEANRSAVQSGSDDVPDIRVYRV